jgi:hypothetical protein
MEIVNKIPFSVMWRKRDASGEIYLRNDQVVDFDLKSVLRNENGSRGFSTWEA